MLNINEEGHRAEFDNQMLLRPGVISLYFTATYINRTATKSLG
jgi:hypothetical protein